MKGHPAVPSIVALVLAGSAVAAETSDADLVLPKVVVYDTGLPNAVKEANVLAARRYDTFWSTGDETLARKALSPAFKDETLPPGRAQGIQGPLDAWKVFHGAVPDVACSVEQMLVVGDRVVTHLHFTGHFTGAFKGVAGTGQKVDFIATDIYRVVDGRIAQNWHLEDNLAFLAQLGVVKP